jgi:bacterioferritin-associated ferredoxin
MIVCNCFAVTDRAIRAAAARGATTPREVARLCHAGSGCGGCVETVRAILAETRAAQAEPSEPLAAPALAVAS